MFRQKAEEFEKPIIEKSIFDQKQQFQMGWKECFSCGRRFRPKMKHEEFCKKCQVEGEAFDLLNNAA
jgi:hypothetical protein